MAEVASRWTKARQLCIAFIGCAVVAACTSLLEPRPDVEVKPVYKVTGASAGNVATRQEVPMVQTMRRGEDNNTR